MDCQSQHDFLDPQENELWDSKGITEALWKKGEAVDEAVDLGEVSLPPIVEAMIPNLMPRLKDLCARDRVESAKVHKFQKRAEEETDEDFKAQALSMLQSITEDNNVTRSDVIIFKSKIRSVVDSLWRSHNEAILAADSRKRKTALEAVASEAPTKQKPKSKRRRVNLGDDDDASSPPVHVYVHAPRKTPTTTPAKAPTPSTRTKTPPPPPTTEIIPPPAPSPPRASTPPAKAPTPSPKPKSLQPAADVLHTEAEAP